MKKRLLALLLLASMVITCFAGCATAEKTEETEKPAPEATEVQATEGKDLYGADFEGYPMNGEDELTVYVLNDSLRAPEGVSRNDNPWHQELAKRVGVKINWLEVPAGADEKQAYNLMIAGDELPDIIIMNETNLRAPQLLEDEKILPLNEYVEQYSPAYMDVINEWPERASAVKDDNGIIYSFCFLRWPMGGGTYSGPCIRQDLLDKLGAEPPVTIDDWDKILHDMKDQGLVKWPISTRNKLGGIFAQFGSAYDLDHIMYLDNNDKVAWGKYTPALKDFLTRLHQWYEDGLIDPDFLSNDRAALEQKVLNSEIGTCWNTAGIKRGYNTKLEAAGKEDHWVGVPQPVDVAGKLPHHIQAETDNIGVGAVITTSCKNIAAACRFLDYGYSEEGVLFYAGGDESNYILTDKDKWGGVQYTDTFMNDPRGLVPMKETYTGVASTGPALFVPVYTAGEIAPDSPALVWTNEEAIKYLLPRSLTLTPDELNSISSENTAVSSYMDEKIAQFIFGKLDIEENFDKYMEELKGLGVEHILEVYQAAYDRFKQR